MKAMQSMMPKLRQGADPPSVVREFLHGAEEAVSFNVRIDGVTLHECRLCKEVERLESSFND